MFDIPPLLSSHQNIQSLLLIFHIYGAIFEESDVENSLKCKQVNDIHAFFSIRIMGIPHTHFLPTKITLDFFIYLGFL
jgi:hypothetical protein